MVLARSSDPDVPRAIVAAATRLFAAQGFDATSVQAVADEVSLTKQAVLHHFPSKEHLRQAVLDAILAHWNDTLPRLLLAAAASEDRFEAVFGELSAFFAADPDRARVVLREALDRPAEMRKLLRGPVRPWLEAVAGYIRSGQAAGKHHADVDPEAYVVHVMLFVISAVASASVMQGALDDEARARSDKELARIARASLFTPARPRGGALPKR
ncbi:TetR/AcrR family transcriptional regulator [Polyangium mundeleinium]|uniref:Helix-turn-helix domain containing protein n=1 Tax=Polyangium mundeleinium TaxID=2995306 RepID=A0ABT5EJS3_9BACT|nr:TetR/AcrR family transcriptional regulator [Polyangium mundeleinium]MDC0742026.1 helix-turn-helix domain containing protein [Polyangium mundeleinium]